MTNESTCRVGILADDLTSAADGAGPFVECGLTAVVHRGRAIDQNADVLAIDMATRSMHEADAAAAAKRATVDTKHADILYKTVDSTLRGHVRAEVEAVMAASDRKQLVFAPAFPEAGRITRGGVQLVNGLPVDQSAYASDPVHPVTSARLSDHLPDSIGNAILLDAETQEELSAQIAAIPVPQDVLWVGSPGMAKALAARFAPQRESLPLPTTALEPLIVVGSANPVSQAQAEFAQTSGCRVLRAPDARHTNPHAVLDELSTTAVSLLNSGTFGAVMATGGDTMEAILNKLGVSGFALSGELEPGFAVGMSDWNGKPLIIGMKAGGFGRPETLLQAAQAITKREEVAL